MRWIATTSSPLFPSEQSVDTHGNWRVASANRTASFDACLVAFPHDRPGESGRALAPTGNSLEGEHMCQVKRRSFLGLSATILGGGLIAGKTGYGLVSGSQDAPGSLHHHVHAVSVMTETANRFLAALSPKQRAKATFQFSDDERMNWQFIPKERKGLALGEMSPHQKHLASALLAAGLSQTGYIKAVTIMSLEDVLKIMENDSGERRNPEKYYFSVFGSPTDAGTW